MERRKFLAALMGAAIAPELDIDKLLWVPGKKRIFVPPVVKLRTVIGSRGMVYIYAPVELTSPD